MSESTAQHDTLHEATGSRARLARVYAEAMLAAAEKSNQGDAIGDELNTIAHDLINKNPRLAEFLGSAAIYRKSKATIIQSAFQGKVSDLFLKFLGVLNQNNRLELIPNIASAYQSIRDRKARRIRVTVRSAVPMTADQTNALGSTLASQLGMTPVLSVRVEPDLLGGLIVQVGDRVYDSSVRTRLNNLKNHLMSSGNHGL